MPVGGRSIVRLRQLMSASFATRGERASAMSSWPCPYAVQRVREHRCCPLYGGDSMPAQPAT